MADDLLLYDHPASIAYVSVLPRVAMYPWIGLPIDAAEYPQVVAWLERLGGRPSFVESVKPAGSRAASRAGGDVRARARDAAEALVGVDALSARLAGSRRHARQHRVRGSRTG